MDVSFLSSSSSFFICFFFLQELQVMNSFQFFALLSCLFACFVLMVPDWLFLLQCCFRDQCLWFSVDSSVCLFHCLIQCQCLSQSQRLFHCLFGCWSQRLFYCLSVCFSVCFITLLECLSICFIVWVFVSASVSLPVWVFKDIYIYIDWCLLQHLYTSASVTVSISDIF